MRAQQRLNQITSQLSGNGCSAFAHVEKSPPDAIFLTKQMYAADKDERKVNLGIGAYRTDEGKPYVLKCVSKAEEQILAKKMNKEYLGQGGLADFTEAAQKLVWGANNPVLNTGRVRSIQSLSGTGALRIAMDFFKKFGTNPVMMYPDPTWGNHHAICKEADVPTSKYRYWDAKQRNLDFNGMVTDISNAPKGSIICLHACAHNPTGVDPTHAQWDGIAAAVKKSGHFVMFDSAYQGFASGDLEKDAYAVRLFTQLNIPFFLCQSFAKNIGLYNERVGCLHMFMDTKDEAVNCESQLKILVRRMFSNPPAHGARIVSTILNDAGLTAQWKQELSGMANRIIKMRAALLGNLKELGTPGDWTHITSQIGMFSFTGLSPAQVEQMIHKHHIYMLKSGRISMAGVNPSNVGYIAAAINDVVRNF